MTWLYGAVRVAGSMTFSNSGGTGILIQYGQIQGLYSNTCGTWLAAYSNTSRPCSAASQPLLGCSRHFGTVPISFCDLPIIIPSVIVAW